MLEIGIVPIIRVNSAEAAIKSIEAVYEGGIRSAEITMTTPGALKALEKLADAFGDKMIDDKMIDEILISKHKMILPR